MELTVNGACNPKSVGIAPNSCMLSRKQLQQEAAELFRVQSRGAHQLARGMPSSKTSNVSPHASRGQNHTTQLLLYVCFQFVSVSNRHVALSQARPLCARPPYPARIAASIRPLQLHILPLHKSKLICVTEKGAI